MADGASSISIVSDLDELGSCLARFDSCSEALVICATALSLIFAVFRANPSPICVLDEVDAPLDDANVERFCNLLDDISAKTQTKFMIITHHALTMSRMDRLFGVTMAERGVSQIVSVDLKRAEEIGAVA